MKLRKIFSFLGFVFLAVALCVDGGDTLAGQAAVLAVAIGIFAGTVFFKKPHSTER